MNDKQQELETRLQELIYLIREVKKEISESITAIENSVKTIKKHIK